jgi:iron complex outermembrane receptor protein
MPKQIARIVNYTVFILPAVIAMAVFAVGGSNALAQSGATSLEEVIVTAQRREESLQDVPGAVSALTELDLERKQIGNVLDLQSSIPNISISQNTGTPSGARIYLRGIGEDESRATVEPAVSMYVDGVFIGRQIGSLFDLLDIERIEVLRGPQGTLYGRNTNGGAIKIISKKPDTSGSSLKAKLTAGEEGRYDGVIAANWAISENSALRFSVMQRTRDGLFETSDGEEVGEWDLSAVRAAYRYTAGDWDVLLSFDAVRDDSDPRPFARTEEVDAAVDDGNVYTLTGNGDSDRYGSEVEQDGLALTISYQWGDYDISSISSYRTLEDELASIIGTPYDQETDQSQFSQEFQITSNLDGPFNWVAGFFYFQEDIDLDYIFVFVPNVLEAHTALEVDTTAWALYGQGYYDFSDTLRLTLGVRYTDEEKDFEGRNLDSSLPAFGFTIPTDILRDDSEDWTNTDVKIALSWDVQDNITLYGSYTTGFRSGAWSPDGLSESAFFIPVEDEQVDAYELGIRSDWLDNRLRANLTVFFNEYEDYQQSGTTDMGFTRYAVDEVETNGAELELTMLPLPGLEVSLNVGYLDGEYTDVSSNAARGLTGVTLEDPTDAAEVAARIALAESNDLKNAPEWNAGLTAIYTLSLQNGMYVSFGTDLAYEKESFNLAANPEELKRDDTFIVNARIALGDEAGGWEVALWGKNLDDEIYYPAAVSGGGGGVFPADPRLWGLDLTLNF